MSRTIIPDESRPVAYHGLVEAARRFFDNPPHPTALIRWGTNGVKLRDGQRLKLALKRQPGKWLVSEQAIREFIDALTADRTGAPAAIPAPSPSKARQQALTRVDSELVAIGI